MKKLLSMLLAIFMVMSLFCAVPVSAAGFTLPYVNYDFNDMTDDATANYGDSIGTWNSKTYIEGVAGGKALYLESAGTSGGSYISLALKDRSPAVMVTGEPFKISFWLKLNTEISKFADSASPAFQLCYTANGGAKGYKGYNFDAQKAALNTGEWVYYEQEIAAWDGKFGTYDTVTNPDSAALNMQFRLGYQNGTAPAALMDSVKNKYAIAIDDFRIEPVRTPYDPNATEEYVEPVETVWENDGSIVGTSAAGNNNVTINGSSRRIYKTVSGGFTGNKGNKYIDVAHSANSYGTHWTNNLNMDYNKLYKVSFYAKASDAANENTRIDFSISRDARWDTTNDPNSNYRSNFHDYYLAFASLTQSWQKCEVWVKRNVKSHDRSQVRFRLDFTAPTGTPINVDVDDILLEEYANPVNCAFENLNYAKQINSLETETTKYVNDSRNYVSNMYGWLADGATVVADTTVKNGGSQSAKVTTTAANGSIYQGVFFENGETKNISFYAKGEGTSIGQPISIVLDRKVTSLGTNDVYAVPDEEILNAVDESGSNLLTSDWKKFTVAYTPNYTTLRDGATMPTISGRNKIGPRQPMMKFKVGDGSAGYTYYLDDLAIREPKAPHPYPYMSDYDLIDASTFTTAVPVENKATYVDYVADTEISADSVSAVVTRIMIESKAGSNKYGTYATLVEESDIATLGETFTIPEGFAGRKIKISVQPFSANGAVGAHYEKVIGTIAKEFEASMSVGNYDPASSSVDVTYSLLNNKVDNSTVRAIMFAMFYAEDGTLVKCVENPIVVANGAQVTNATFSPVSTPIETDLQSLTVASAKVFFWYTEGTDTPSVYNTTMVEVLPSENVVFPS